MNICSPLGFGPYNEKQWLNSHNIEVKVKELIKKDEKRIRDYYEDLDNHDDLWENMRNKRPNYRSWEHGINIESDEEIADEDSDEE
ncbi:hypothetical protein D1007_34166 [Hordeum vulgare]|nr:hypothetical protein D1007_34166 [Hordeum vulgare]